MQIVITEWLIMVILLEKFIANSSLCVVILVSLKLKFSQDDSIIELTLMIKKRS